MIGGFDGDDGFIIESYGVSWLIWINLLVMFLLIVVLYYFTVLVSDGAAATMSELGQISAKKYGQLEFRESKNNYYIHKNISRSSCSQQDIKVYKDKIINRGNPSTSRGRREIEENQTMEEVKEYSATTTSYNQCSSYNPCYLLELGKKAFLKCLGLDSTTTPDSSSAVQKISLSSENNVQGKLNETDKSK